MRPFGYLRRNRRSIDADISEELEHHLRLKVDELRGRGLSSNEARQEAQRLFGDLEYTRRYCRQQDLRKENQMQRTLMVADTIAKTLLLIDQIGAADQLNAIRIRKHFRDGLVGLSSYFADKV